MTEAPPGFLLMLAPLLALALRGRALAGAMVVLPLLSFAHLLSLPADHVVEIEALGMTFVPVRVDRLSLVWGYVFHIAAFLCALYAWHEDDRVQHGAGAAYAGSAIAAAFCGDLVSLFVFWELTAVTSVFLIWATRTPEAEKTARRYLIIQVASGVILLAGILMRFAERRSIEFDYIGAEELSGGLILFAVGIKAAFPLLHNWLQDAYPKATVTGAVVLSAFTTKLAIYVLARGFYGTEILVPIGCVMTLFPIVFAVIENDLRRVLAYSLNNQLGYMVVGVGVGTDLAINGVAAHAFAHIIYKGLLFMAMGAVLHRTGTIKASELGGLYKSMPLTAVFCIVGSLSISGFPLLSGFVSKSMTLTATAEAHWAWVSFGLLIASAGVVDHSGIKIPFFAFFAHDSGRRVKEAPPNMLAAMALAAGLCIAFGVYPSLLYGILPNTVDYEPYTVSHVVTSLQLLLWAALAFTVMWRFKWYPPELRAINLDSDWVYRRAIPRLAGPFVAAGRGALGIWQRFFAGYVPALLRSVRGVAGPNGAVGEPVGAGAGATWTVIFLLACLFAMTR